MPSRHGLLIEKPKLGEFSENSKTPTVKGLLGPFLAIDLFNGSHGLSEVSNVGSRCPGDLLGSTQPAPTSGLSISNFDVIVLLDIYDTTTLIIWVLSS